MKKNMDKKKAEAVRGMFYELGRLQFIKRTIEREEKHWWSFLTPDTKRWEGDGLYMSTILREEFMKAVDRSIERLNKQIEEL